MTSEWVYDLRGKEVVFTGKFDGYVKAELAKIALHLGARNVSGWVNQSSTDVLVRGWSPQWKYGDYGDRENRLQKRRRMVTPSSSSMRRVSMVSGLAFPLKL